jgi:hypothetical protein
MKIGKLVLVALVISVLSIACSAQAPADILGEPGFAPEPAMMEDGGISSDSSNRFAQGGEASPVNPMVIRNANLSLVVDDPGKSADDIGKMAEGLGGFVVSSNVFQSNSSTSSRVATRASVSVRVPVDQLDEALERIQENAIEVREKRISGEDVTQQFTDLQSKLRNLEAAEEQLLGIMDAATDTEDVLRVFNDLRNVREQIELIKGQMNYFEDSARLSLINVELIPDELAQPIEIGGWRPEGTAKQAVETLITALQFIADAGIWVVICILPIALLLGVPGYFIGRRVIQRRKSREETGTTAESAEIVEE